LTRRCVQLIDDDDDDGRAAFERRTAPRVLIARGVRFALTVPTTSRWRNRPRFDSVEATVVDLSESGARLVARRSAGLSPGATVGIRRGDADGDALLVRVAASSTDGFVELGVAFARLSPTMKEIVAELISGGNPVPDWRRSGRA
jgi:hypothetical protein